MYKYSNVYSGEESPKDKSVLWLHHETKNDLSSPLIAEIFNKGKWIPMSLSDSSGSGDTSTDIQIVELTYDHLPATGTLSASDLAKLDSDNCLLVMNGKYFRKTFSSNGGIDYKEIGLTTVLGGVRSIYFTASKPDGEYTIAYTYPIEANTQTQATTPLENIKVGNTTYSVSGSGGSVASLVVKGSTQEDDGDYYFSPDDNQPTFSEAVEAFNSGVQIIFDINPNPTSAMPDGAYFRSTALECVSDYGGSKYFYLISGGAPVFWYETDTDEGGNVPVLG